MYQQTQPQAFTTLSDLGVAAIYCTRKDEAHKLIDEMAADAGTWPVGLDFETTPLPPETARLAALGKDLAAAEGNLRALRLCRALPARIEEKRREVGRLKAAIKYVSSAGLDPHRSSIRLLQLDGDELASWQRTPKSGELSTSRAELSRAARYPPVRELVRANKIGKLLETFGENWLAHVSPVTGRIHAAYRVAGAASGRATCAAPNVQQIPKDKRFRELFVAPAGRLLICADYSSMELRAAAHISGDREMTAAFVRGDDLHVLTAARVTGKNPADVTQEERSSAKPVNFGSIYGQGARGLASSAWANYGIVLTVQEAEQWQRGFNVAFPGFGRWRTSHYQRVERERKIVIGCDAAQGVGRIFQTSWLPRDQPAYTRSCNYPIQGACADASMLALAAIDQKLFEEGIDGGPVAWMHDEIVLEVPAEHAAKAAELLNKAMTDAFAETFPGAPLRDLVKAHIGADWAAAKS